MRSVSPVSNSRVGVPLVVSTVTASENSISMDISYTTMTQPSTVEEETPLTAGAVVTITRALLSAKDPDSPGSARVRVASLPAAS